MAKTCKGRSLIKKLQNAIDVLLNPILDGEQRVDTTQVEPPTITRITDAPAIMQTRDLTAKLNLIKTKSIHQCQTCNNTPGAVPAIK
jgi:hypothetical protein